MCGSKPFKFRGNMWSNIWRNVCVTSNVQLKSMLKQFLPLALFSKTRWASNYVRIVVFTLKCVQISCYKSITTMCHVIFHNNRIIPHVTPHVTPYCFKYMYSIDLISNRYILYAITYISNILFFLKALDLMVNVWINTL